MKNHICKICKKEFIKTGTYQLYCSLSCKNKAYYQCNHEKILNRVKKYQLIHKEEILFKVRENYRIHNKERREHQKNRLKSDISFRLRHNLRVRIHDVIKYNYKSASTMQLIGCSIEKLKEHLQRQFRLGMTWNNYGQWEIDHIKPCIFFDLSKLEEQNKCFNYKNLQPLWMKENRSKSSKIL